MLPEAESEPFLRDDASNSHTEQSQPTYQAAARKRLISSTQIITHFLVFALTSIIWGTIFMQNRASRPPHSFGAIHYQISTAKWQGCGSSPEEAKQRNCMYDILSNHWVPKPCADQRSVEEYQSDGSWLGYRYENRTDLLTIDAMGDLPVYYTSVRDHIVHCAALWKRQYRAFFEGRQNIDNIIVDTKHTMHCAEYLINMTDYGTDFWAIPIPVEVGYSGCYSLD